MKTAGCSSENSNLYLLANQHHINQNQTLADEKKEYIAKRYTLKRA